MQYKILIVDDEPSVVQTLNKFFMINGFQSSSAASAEEALDMVAKEKFDIYFLDIKLPGMSGTELCRELKKNSPASVFFAMTGYSSVFDLMKCREAGFDDYFIKPFKLMDVMEFTNQAFEKISRWHKSGSKSSL